jgi:hypothetical protein
MSLVLLRQDKDVPELPELILDYLRKRLDRVRGPKYVFAAQKLTLLGLVIDIA